MTDLELVQLHLNQLEEEKQQLMSIGEKLKHNLPLSAVEIKLLYKNSQFAKENYIMGTYTDPSGEIKYHLYWKEEDKFERIQEIIPYEETLTHNFESHKFPISSSFVWKEPDGLMGCGFLYIPDRTFHIVREHCRIIYPQTNYYIQFQYPKEAIGAVLLDNLGQEYTVCCKGKPTEDFTIQKLPVTKQKTVTVIRYQDRPVYLLLPESPLHIYNQEGMKQYAQKRSPNLLLQEIAQAFDEDFLKGKYFVKKR